MKNSKLRRVLMLAVCAVMLVCLSVGATLAYLTSTDEVKNTFTVGKVAITLDEAKVNTDGTAVTPAERVKANTYKLMPGHNYTKDPTIHVDAGSEDCWLFVKVENGISAIEAETTIAQQMKANGWVELEGKGVYYHAVIKSADTDRDIEIFSNFTIAGTVDNDTLAKYDEATVNVTAYAVQADGFNTAADAWNATFGATTTVTE